MEHLDLAGVITNWNLPAFEQQDAIYLSNSRQMLEPILEETSEDEEYAQNSWNQYENGTTFWSSAESETGSVIRIEVNKDPDSISERDFACPAKRARRSDEFLIGGAINNTATNSNHSSSTQHQHQQQQQLQLQQQHLNTPSSLEDTVLLRKYQRNERDYNETTNSLERFLAYEASSRDSFGSTSQQRNSTGSRRFDDFYSDSDSLSYQSLSRSSSLIQFESLERQLLLQEQHASMTSLGNSSPSLLSFDGANGSSDDAGACGGGARSNGGNSGSNSGNNSRRGSQSSLLKRFESSDGRLHQTYFDLDKLNFDEDDTSAVLFGAGKACMEATIGEIKSDSESSTSSGNSILTASKPSAEDLTDSSCALGAKTARISAFQRGGKNSAENLSEDSGYCEPSTLRRTKSKSIPKNFEKFCEEDEEFQQYELRRDNSATAVGGASDEISSTASDAENIHSKNSNTIQFVAARAIDGNKHEMCQPKINNTAFRVESNDTATATATASAVTLNRKSPETPLPVTTTTTTTTSTTTACPPRFERVKNSPTREPATFEHLRSLAHSPSPVSSEASSASSRTTRSTASSTTSASTCASAASFTWLPLQMRQSQPQQHAVARRQELQEKEWMPRREFETLGDFCPQLRNSLPDIRDAFSSEAYFSYRSREAGAHNGHGLEHSQATAIGSPTTTPAAAATTADDSDILTSSSASAHDSRSDETDAETTPEARKRYVGTGGGGGSVGFVGGGSLGGGGRARGGCVNRDRISSVPNELNKLGRRKRTGKFKYSKSTAEKDAALNSSTSTASSSGSSDEDNDDEDFFAESCLQIRRSCSWSERRERNFQKYFGECPEPKAEPTSSEHWPEQALGYMNASYHDLTLLDYSGRKPIKNQANYKRCGAADSATTMEDSRKSSGDYESLICKGNFLLDELSEIYDKNASIMNDRTVEADHEPIVETKLLLANLQLDQNVGPKPVAPPRQRMHSSSSYSDHDAGDGAGDGDGEVQHVQLTIRKPPARQKHGRNRDSANTNSLINECGLPFVPLGKTFDQDPTNLHTSYAQSLEKCNFDAKEVSNTDLTKVCAAIPKRRFQSQAASAKKRTLVSSTPNLNAFDPRADEIEDDMYVSSAHNSMHTLPQANAQKPLGILLPAGSRSSFGKEVSFCPVVSKYCWQEQSSEECNEPPQPEEQLDQEEAAVSARAEEDSDDELLDNADATVIYNTRENEMIAARYNAEQQARTQKSVAHVRDQPQVEKVRALLIVRERVATEEHKTSHEHEHDHTGDDDNHAEQEPTSEQPYESAAKTSQAAEPATPVMPATPSSAHQALNEVSLKRTVADDAPVTTQVSRVNNVNVNVNVNVSAVSDSVRPSSATSTQHEQAKRTPPATATATTRTATRTTTGNTVHARPLSIQLPILSEPPTNRAHHILYASQQLLDNFERREFAGGQLGGVPHQVKSASSYNIGQNVRMSAVGENGGAGAIGASANANVNANASANNNNELMKSKFKADEKHPNSKGFLSRFANGFRFSLRRNKKKQLQQQQQQQLQQQQLQQQQQQLAATGAIIDPNGHAGKVEKSPVKPVKGAKTTAANGQKKTGAAAPAGGKKHAPDYIFIPLKGPLPADRSTVSSNNNNSSSANSSNGPTMLHNESGCSHEDSTASTASVSSGGRGKEQLPQTSTLKVTGKPPLPKQPPRQQHPQNPTHAHQEEHPQMQQLFEGNNSGCSNNSNSSSSAANFTTPGSQYATDFLASERSYYYDDFKNQLNSGMQANGYVGGGAAAAAVTAAAAVPSSGYVIQHNSTSSNNNNNNNSNSNNNKHCKIGLIETNLDTHETIITGKTRSLMDIGPKQLSIAGGGCGGDGGGVGGFTYGGKRLNITTAGEHHRIGAGADMDDDNNDDDDDDYAADGSGIRRKQSAQAGGAQIASVRRPHKSMEFLLDKENQKNVLVCTMDIP